MFFSFLSFSSLNAELWQTAWLLPTANKRQIVDNARISEHRFHLKPPGERRETRLCSRQYGPLRYDISFGIQSLPLASLPAPRSAKSRGDLTSILGRGWLFCMYADVRGGSNRDQLLEHKPDSSCGGPKADLPPMLWSVRQGSAMATDRKLRRSFFVRSLRTAPSARRST